MLVGGRLSKLPSSSTSHKAITRPFCRSRRAECKWNNHDSERGATGSEEFDLLERINNPMTDAAAGPVLDGGLGESWISWR
jgi:hypothetical protein